MTIEDRLRRSLRRRGAEAQTSHEAWDRIADRIDRAPRPSRWLVPALALGTAAALVTVTVAVMGQGEDASDIEAAGGAPTTTLARQSIEGAVPISASFPGIWPENTWHEYIPTFQHGADPSRLDPVEVATAYLHEKGLGLPEAAVFEAFPEDPTCGHVRYTLPGGDPAEGNFVEVCRAVLPDGAPFTARGPEGGSFEYPTDELPFVVTAAWTDRFMYREPLYESPLEFGIGISVPGSLDVRSGAFNSEWIDEQTIHVTAEEIEGPGYQVPVTLALGPNDTLPKSLLVQIVHRAPGSAPVAFTEFRLDLADDSPQARFPESTG